MKKQPDQPSGKKTGKTLLLTLSLSEFVMAKITPGPAFRFAIRLDMVGNKEVKLRFFEPERRVEFRRLKRGNYEEKGALALTRRLGDMVIIAVPQHQEELSFQIFLPSHRGEYGIAPNDLHANQARICFRGPREITFTRYELLEKKQQASPPPDRKTS